MVPPVREDALFDLLVEALLHAVHILELVGGHTLVLTPLSALNCFFERARTPGSSTIFHL